MNKKQRLNLLNSYYRSIKKGHYGKALEQNEQLYNEISLALKEPSVPKDKLKAGLKQLVEEAMDLKRLLGIIIFNVNNPEEK